MRSAASSMSLLRCLLRNCDGGRRLDWTSFLVRVVAVEGGQQHRSILRSRSFASDTDKGSTSSDTPSPGDEQENKKSELGRWWQTFSEQTRAQAGNVRKTNRDFGQRPVPKGYLLSGQEEHNPASREGGGNQWFIPKDEKLLGQEQRESLNKETISRWFQPKDVEESSTEQDRQEITSKQVGARWLASLREKSSIDGESSDLSSSSWFGLSKETPASERERLEVSMQRLSLMSKLGDNSQTPSFMFLPPKNYLLRRYFDWENLSSPEKHKATLTKVRQEFQIHKTDCGSSQVQIAQLTTKIKYMTKHMETHRKDYHSRKGLEAMVQQRRKILKYLRRKDWDAYCDVISKLGLRDNVMEQQKR